MKNFVFKINGVGYWVMAFIALMITKVLVIPELSWWVVVSPILLLILIIIVVSVVFTIKILS